MYEIAAALGGVAVTGVITGAVYWMSKADERAKAKQDLENQRAVTDYLGKQQMIDKSNFDKALNSDTLKDIIAGRETSDWGNDKKTE